MPFDIESARKEGYTDEEIAQHLASTRGFDYNSAIKEGYSPSEVVSYLSSKSSTVAPGSTISPKTMEWSQVPGEALRNVPGSAYETIKGVLKGLTPYTPSEGFKVPEVTKLVTGIPSSARQIFDISKPLPPPGSPESSPLLNMADAIISRYGSMEKFKQTLAKDPVGALMDLSTVLIPVSKGASAVMNPLKAPSTVTKGVIKSIPGYEKPGQGTYLSALKPPVSASIAERERVAQAGLRTGATMSQEGYDLLSSDIKNTMSKVNDVISEGAAKGDTIEPLKIAEQFDELKAKYKNEPIPQPFIEAIDKAEKMFLDAQGEGPMSVAKAQAMKQQGYSSIGDAAFSSDVVGIGKEIRMSLARGIRLELEKKYPELAGLNEQAGAAIELRNTIETAVNRINNKDLLDIGPWVTGALLESVTGNPRWVAGGAIAKHIIDTPKVKIGIAKALYNARKEGFKQGLPAYAGQAGYQSQKENPNAARP